MTFEEPVTSVAQGAIQGLSLRRDPALRTVECESLVAELVARLSDSSTLDGRLSVRQLGELQSHLDRWLEKPENRFSLAYTRQLFEVLWGNRPTRMDLRGCTFLELGSGAENPLALGAVMLAMGAKRALALDDSPIIDVPRAVMGVGRVVQELLADPRSLVPTAPPSVEHVLEAFRDFDLARIRRGDPTGINRSRLDYLQQSADRVGLPDGSCDLICSSAVLEHVPDVDRVAREMARLTRIGGMNVHNVDYNDHGIYSGQAATPISFLTECADRSHVRTCNRARHSQVVRSFREAGFELVEDVVYERRVPSSADLKMLLPRFASLSMDDLETTRALFVVVRRR